MKPFDLEAALRGEPVVTRDGKIIDELFFFKSIDKIYGIIGKTVYYWNPDGSFWNDTKSENDLFMAEKPKVKKEGWVTIFKNDTHFRGCSHVYRTKEEAKSVPFNEVFATIKIEWEEEAE